jgi:hypothetical protein
MTERVIKIFIVSLFLFIGCVDENYIAPEWKLAPGKYRCTKEQFDRVKFEAEWCTEKTSYISQYCWGTALIRNCVKPEANNDR